MEKEFWLKRWEENLIGFHQDQVNQHLANFIESYFDDLSGKRVFVPLCGKSLDLLWLAKQGFEVIGVELSPLAVQQFFNENQLKPEIKELGTLKLYTFQNINLYVGDFFDITTKHLGRIDFVYDRAALIALPFAMRQKYLQHMLQFFSASTLGLFILLNYDQSKVDGPPFSVEATELAEKFQIKEINCAIVDNVPDKFQQAAIEVKQKVYLVKA
jgi:thiopurine S-methyltransferase